MVHIPDKVYECLAECIKEGGSGLSYWMCSVDEYYFSADVSVRGRYEQYFTGVEYMGDRERYWEFVVDSWDVRDFRCENGDFEVVETDFEKSKIEEWL